MKRLACLAYKPWGLFMLAMVGMVARGSRGAPPYQGGMLPNFKALFISILGCIESLSQDLNSLHPKQVYTLNRFNLSP
jgi:hypothetical protein